MKTTRPGNFTILPGKWLTWFSNFGWVAIAMSVGALATSLLWILIGSFMTSCCTICQFVSGSEMRSPLSLVVATGEVGVGVVGVVVLA